MSIIGINGRCTVNKVTEIEIRSKITSIVTKIQCLVIPKITEPIPSNSFNIKDLQIPSSVKLADPFLHCSAPVDLMIGAELFLSLLLAGKIILEKNQPVLQNTVFGYILGGSLGKSTGREASCYKVNLEQTIARFWELENSGLVNEEQVPSVTPNNPSEQHFYDTTTRLPDGRFMVRLPFKEHPPILGKSKEAALSRLLSVERKRARDNHLNEAYVNFMREYHNLGHMELIADDTPENSFYLPHSCLVNLNSTTTRHGVVFDGSCKSSNNLSLNDNLLAGPVLQPDLFIILIQFRKHQYVLTADISKMYRCTLIHPDDQNYHKILWRETTDAPVQAYNLKTVTYGLTPSSYQAIKCVQQLGIEETTKFPLAYPVFMNTFYLDDVLFGSDSVRNLIDTKEELKTVLSKGCFVLSKWSSNNSAGLEHEGYISSKNCLIVDKERGIKQLTAKKPVTSSSISSISPFVDKNNIIRLGDRLRNAQVSEDKKISILLPKHFVAELIVKEAHLSQLHAGHSGTLTHVRQKYWPISGRSQV
ncbi:hypothetical protein Zmor_021384 [Zophobas morio]|uniref:Peptidase aspartic putative domain-containing protein n=1 Tax=Zophobas morio TaxID=2755281 RepID=A0AA38MBF0_9CUCU|nr:hypothetical protein Zmor_021384 [Zophobas morio]